MRIVTYKLETIRHDIGASSFFLRYYTCLEVSQHGRASSMILVASVITLTLLLPIYIKAVLSGGTI